VTSGTLWRAAAALFGCLVVTWMLIIAGAQHVVTIPIHQNAAAVRSTAGTAAVNRYVRATEESRQLARALVASDNLPGLSAAVAVNGELVWAEAFGWSDVEIQTPLTPQTRFRLGAA